MALPTINNQTPHDKFLNRGATVCANQILREAKKKDIPMTQSKAMSLAWNVIHTEPYLKILTFRKKSTGELTSRLVTSFVWNHYTPNGKGHKTTKPIYKFIDLSAKALTGNGARSVRSCDLSTIVSIHVSKDTTTEQLEKERKMLTPPKETGNVQK